MGWQDRPYYRDRRPSPLGPLEWITSGSVPLYTAFGIRVRAHAMLVIGCALVLLFGAGTYGRSVEDRVESVSVLFAIVLLHEYGHCFMARWVGGTAEDILMHPLGGLAMTRPPRRWGPTFLTVAAGPGVNVLICLTAGALLWITTGSLPWYPFNWSVLRGLPISWINVPRYAYWVYSISYALLLFNLLPIFPLDGGQMVQALLWPKLGYYRSMLVMLTVGMVGSVLLAMFGLATFSVMLIVLAGGLFLFDYQHRLQLLAAGPYEFADDGIDYSAAYENPTRRRTPTRSNLRAAAKANKAVVAEAAEREQVDRILAKVSATGMASLTRGERKTLKLATEHRRRNAEVTR